MHVSMSEQQLLLQSCRGDDRDQVQHGEMSRALEVSVKGNCPGAFTKIPALKAGNPSQTQLHPSCSEMLGYADLES